MTVLTICLLILLIQEVEAAVRKLGEFLIKELI